MGNGKKWYDTTLGKIGIGLTTGGVGLGVRHFAKKYSEANKGINQQVSALQNQQVAPEIVQANQEAQMMKNQGLSSTALGLYRQQSDRAQSSAFSQLGGRRAALAGAGDIVRAAQDAGLRLADIEQQARERNRQQAMQSSIGLGKEKMGLQRYKQEGLFNYWMGKKQALNTQVSNIAKGAMRIGAAVATGGASEVGQFRQ